VLDGIDVMEHFTAEGDVLKDLLSLIRHVDDSHELLVLPFETSQVLILLMLDNGSVDKPIEVDFFKTDVEGVFFNCD